MCHILSATAVVRLKIVFLLLLLLLFVRCDAKKEANINENWIKKIMNGLSVENEEDEGKESERETMSDWKREHREEYKTTLLYIVQK